MRLFLLERMIFASYDTLLESRNMNPKSQTPSLTLIVMRTKGPLPKPSTVYPPTIRVLVKDVVVFGIVDKFKLLNPALFFPNPTLQWFQRLVL